MKKNSKKFLLSFGIWMFGNSLLGQSKVGTTAVPFLGISPGPRAFAMGSAFVAMAEDPLTLYYNPGGMGRTEHSRFLASHTQWLLGTGYSWMGALLRLNYANVLGISITYLNYGEEEVTTVLDQEGTGERWGASDLAVGLSYCRNLTDRFSIGGTAKYIQQRIWNETGSAFALDIGLLFITPLQDIRLGMSISNFGTDVRMDGRDLIKKIDLDPESQGHNEAIVAKLKTDTWPLPLFFRVGIAKELWESKFSRLTLAIDALRPSDNTETLQLGTEMAFYEKIFLRAGYKSLFRKDSEEGLTYGFGLRIPIRGTQGWNVDYTIADYGRLENVHSASIGISF